jgi:hypothetical protein
MSHLRKLHRKLHSPNLLLPHPSDQGPLISLRGCERDAKDGRNEERPQPTLTPLQHRYDRTLIVHQSMIRAKSLFRG